MSRIGRRSDQRWSRTGGGDEGDAQGRSRRLGRGDGERPPHAVVVAAVRRPDALGDLADRVSVVDLDTTDVDAMPAVVDKVLAEHGRIDVLGQQRRPRVISARSRRPPMPELRGS